MLTKIRKYSVPLIAGIIISFVWANLSPDSYNTFIHYTLFTVAGQEIDMHFIVNDIFMCFFFVTAAIEIVSSLTPGGALYPIKKATAPLLATLGGVLGPVAMFFVLNALFGKPEYSSGWGICTATDIALAWMLARIVFGGSHPAVSFLLLLAVADDAIGVIIIAVFYPDPLKDPSYLWLLLVLLALVVAGFYKRVRIDVWWLYLLIPGIIAWIGMYMSNLHPALAFAFIVPFMYRKKTEADTFSLIGKDPMGKCEKHVSRIVDYGLILFGLANAGVAVSQVSSLTWIILISLVVGKTLGVTLMSLLARAFKIPLPTGMGFREIICAGLVAGMGLTVALFIANSAFADAALLSASKMGAMFSVVVFIIAPICGKLFKIMKVTKI